MIPSKLSTNRFTNTWLSTGESIPWQYVIWRVTLATMAWLGFIHSVWQTSYLQSGSVVKYFIYLTNIGRILTCITLGLEAALVISRYSSKNEDKSEKEIEDAGSPIFCSFLWILSNCSSCLSLLICSVYWTAIHDPSRSPMDLENVSGHLLPALSSLADMGVSDRPWLLIHVSHSVSLTAIYAVFSILFHALGGTNFHGEPFIYQILDWAKPHRAVIFVVTVAFLLIVFHLFFCVLYSLREMYKIKRTFTSCGNTSWLQDPNLSLPLVTLISLGLGKSSME